MKVFPMEEQLCLFLPELFEEADTAGQREKNQAPRRRRPPPRLPNQSLMCLDLRPDAGNLLGVFWEHDPYELLSRGHFNNSLCPYDEVVLSSLSDILEDAPGRKYYLSRTACLGILRRARERGKDLPPQLVWALMVQAGLLPPETEQPAVPPPEGCLNPWDTQQARVFVPEGTAQTLTGADGGGGRNPAGLLLEENRPAALGVRQRAAGFCAGAGPSAGGVGYSEELSPTLKAANSGTNMVPSILCLTDQGGGRMDCGADVSGTLRAQEHGHQPLIQREPVFCITGNAIDRQPQNGGNGFGCQEDISYTLTATDRHSIYARQRVDEFREDDVASTESARQHKDATDLVCSRSADKEGAPLLLRRLTPLECERLQGFPNGWTDIPGAADSARYRALGNSVAIPCVAFILQGISMAAGRPV